MQIYSIYLEWFDFVTHVKKKEEQKMKEKAGKFKVDKCQT